MYPEGIDLRFRRNRGNAFGQGNWRVSTHLAES